MAMMQVPMVQVFAAPAQHFVAPQQQFLGPQVQAAAPNMVFLVPVQAMQHTPQSSRAVSPAPSSSWSTPAPSSAPSSEPGSPVSRRPSLKDLPVAGNVWKLSRDAEGCRRVQSALEDASSDDVRAALAQELRGHIWQALRCPHANHVLQKCFMTMRPNATQFIIDELVARGPKAVVKAAQDQYACRVVQRMVEHCRPDQVAPIVETLLEVGASLARHIYGIFVMQHLLEQGTESQRSNLVAQLVAQVREKGMDQRTGRVLRTALSCASREDQLQAAQAFVFAKELTALARDRGSYTCAIGILAILQGEDLAEAKRQLLAELPSLSASRYGRKVVRGLDSSACGAAAAMGGA